MADSTVEQKATELLEQLRQMLEAGGEFVAEQAPPLAAEIVTWGRTANTIGALGLWIMAVACVVVLRRHVVATKARMGTEYEFTDCEPFVIAPLIVLAITSGIGGSACAPSALMAWVAPRLYILTYIKGLL